MNPSLRHIPGIDGLRAIAVLSVLIFHVRPSWLPGGFTGVDVFFVISGYVVSASLARDDTQTFWGFLRGFYSRRLIRIYPGLLACLLGTFLLAVLFIPASWLSTTTWKTGLLAFAGFSNFGLVGSDDGYFSPRVEYNAFTHTWSLGVEEQFYLLYPLLCFAVQHGGRASWRAVWLVIGVPAMLSSLYCVWSSTAQPEQAFYLLPSRFWELAAGGLLFFSHRQGMGLLRKVPQDGVLLTGLLMVAIGFVWADARSFPFPWALLPVAGTLLCIAASVQATLTESGVTARCLTHPLLRYVGRISFSLYLWHWPVFVLFRWTVGLEDAWTATAAVVLALLLAMLSYHGVEVPARTQLARWGRTAGQILSRGWLFVGLCAGMALGLVQARPWVSLSTVTRNAQDWYPVSDGQVLPDPAQARELQGRTLFVVGDSHVGAYALMLDILSRETGVRVQKFWGPGCSALRLNGPLSPLCEDVLADAARKIAARASAGDLVFLAGLHVPRLSDQWAAFDKALVISKQQSPEAREARRVALGLTSDWIDKVGKSGVRILIEMPKPVLPAPPFRCADWFNQSNPVCGGGFSIERDRWHALATPALQSIADLTRLYPELRTWDPALLLCPGTTCHAKDAAGHPLYFDGDHLSAWGNRVLVQSFREAVRATLHERT